MLSDWLRGSAVVGHAANSTDPGSDVSLHVVIHGVVWQVVRQITVEGHEHITGHDDATKILATIGSLQHQIHDVVRHDYVVVKRPVQTTDPSLSSTDCAG